MRPAIIINPVSGRGDLRPTSGADRKAAAGRLVAEAGTTADIVITGGPGDAARLARTFVGEGRHRVIAWGGDGTINEIAGPLVGGRTVLGIVPSGSGDGTARSLGLPTSPVRAFGVALGAAAGAIDVGFLGDRHFLNVAGIGFDAAVAAAFDRRGRRGGWGYVATGLTIVWTYRCQRYRVDLAGERSDGERFLLAFANGREYGNGVVLAPDADPRDGWLDALLVDSGSPIRQMWRARRLILRRRRPASGLTRVRVRSASVSGQTLECHVDGETFAVSGTLDVRIEPGALLVAGA
jgi:YegS/Rv2252/BmrU family lipid kinase